MKTSANKISDKNLSTDRFRILFDHSSDAHFIVNENGITDCNEATVKLLKCRNKSEVLSIHPGLLSPEFQPDGRRSAEKLKEMDALARANGFHRFEWVHRKMDGEEFPVEVTLNAVEIDGKPALVAVWHDLTKAKRAERQLKDLNERMKNELESAAEFQRSLLPAENPASKDFESFWFYKPSEELGGDSLNIFKIDQTRVGAYVLDVTGHGVASALLSVTVTHFLSGFYKDHCPREIAKRLNDHFSKENYVNHSFTLLYGVLDLKDLSFTYTSAGHAGPLRVKKDGRTEQFDSHGPPVGMFEGIEYLQSRILLERGDRLFLFSDGVYEVRNSKDEPLGLERVHQHFQNENANEYTLPYTVNSLAREVYHWSLPKKPDDDLSIVGIEIK